MGCNELILLHSEIERLKAELEKDKRLLEEYGRYRGSLLAKDALCGEIERLEADNVRLEESLSAAQKELKVQKLTVVSAIGGVDYEGFPTSEINYLQRLRILLKKEESGIILRRALEEIIELSAYRFNNPYDHKDAMKAIARKALEEI
jgi:uncharacterized small protein (DUF1192 family)